MKCKMHWFGAAWVWENRHHQSCTGQGWTRRLRCGWGLAAWQLHEGVLTGRPWQSRVCCSVLQSSCRCTAVYRDMLRAGACRPVWPLVVKAFQGAEL